MGRLQGKTALITGAARGMGASHARLFVQEGASVVITDVRVDEGHALCATLGPKSQFLQHDVTSGASWADVVAATEAIFGPLNILVNNAAIGYVVPFDDLTEAEYRRFIDVNQVSVFLGIKAALPSMTRAKGGSIINVSSASGIVAAEGTFAYVASKFAVRGMTKAAALDFIPRNIRVNSVHPGLIRTPMLAGTTAAADLTGVVPMGRLGEPEEISNLVLFLASDESSYCTGAEFIADGGYTAH